MSSFTARERLLTVMEDQKPDRPPVICPGGMMNAAIVEVIKQSGVKLPEAHTDPVLMAKLAKAVQADTGFENFGIPFCMTVEAEILGSRIDYGSLACEPKIAQEKYPNTASVVVAEDACGSAGGRMAVVAEASRILAAQCPDIPVVGSLTGPVSLAASIVDPMLFLKDLRKNPAAAHRVLDYVTGLLIDFAATLARNGATAISFADPTATGEILGPAMFKEYAVPYLQKAITAVHEIGLPVIVHICGDLNPVKASLLTLGADVISVDAVMSLRRLKEEFPSLKTMGNVSTFMLESGPADKIQQRTAQLVTDGIDIIAPACGLSTSTPLANIRALTETVLDTN